MAFCDTSGVALQRQQRPLTGAFPDLAAALTPFQRDGVVVDGEVVVWRAGRLDFAALQDRLRSGPARTRELAAAAPAAFVVFDLLAHRGTDLRDHPYAQRRAALEALLNRGLPPGVVLPPTTTGPAVAHSWLAGHTASGIEGVVAKHADHPYRPGVRGWQKLRARLTREAVVGGVLGPPAAPTVLILGRPDVHGLLQVAGRSKDLTPAAGAAVGAALRGQVEAGIHGRRCCRGRGGAAARPSRWPTPGCSPRWWWSWSSTRPWTARAGATPPPSSACAPTSAPATSNLMTSNLMTSDR